MDSFGIVHDRERGIQAGPATPASRPRPRRRVPLHWVVLVALGSAILATCGPPGWPLPDSLPGALPGWPLPDSLPGALPGWPLPGQGSEWSGALAAYDRPVDVDAWDFESWDAGDGMAESVVIWSLPR